MPVIPTWWSAIWAALLAISLRMGVSLLVLLGFWIAAKIAQAVIRQMGAARRVDRSMVNLLAQTAFVALLAVGVVSALGTLGVNVTALVASLGLAGLALGLALKDIVSNAVAGVLVIIYKPFRPGDRVKVLDFQGSVEQIDLRYTTLQGEEKRIFVPNSLVFNNAIIVDVPPL